jgi:hypothetical protein
LTTTKTTYPAPREGQVLPNGARVLRAKEVERLSKEDPQQWIVLCDFMELNSQFITWHVWYLDNGTFATDTGHYFADSSYQEALEDFRARK